MLKLSFLITVACSSSQQNSAPVLKHTPLTHRLALNVETDFLPAVLTMVVQVVNLNSCVYYVSLTSFFVPETWITKYNNIIIFPESSQHQHLPQQFPELFFTTCVCLQSHGQPLHPTLSRWRTEKASPYYVRSLWKCRCITSPLKRPKSPSFCQCCLAVHSMGQSSL